MTKPHGEDATGQKLDLIGQPLRAGRGSSPGVGITRKETFTMPKAERNGRYKLGDYYFRIRAGDEIPTGAEMVDDEERANPKAPENRAKGAAPENRMESPPENRGDDSATDDPLGELSNDAYAQLSPQEKGARTRQFNEQQGGEQ
jgi:hypothetical protein